MRKLKSFYFTLIISIFYCLIAASVGADSMPWTFLLLGDNAPQETVKTRSMPWLSLLLEDNVSPVADAGPDQTVKTGEVVYLDGGNSSDADNDSLTYNWTMERPEGSSAQLSYSSNSSSAQFTPDVDGVYTLTLIVNDGKVNSAPDTVVVTSVSNFPPVADAGPDQTVNTGELVSLDGSGSSDADGDTLTYYWSLEKPEGSSAILAYDANLGWAKFTPDIDGIYTLTLIVNDGKVSSDPDTVVITSQ